MDIYAKAKYNRTTELSGVVNNALNVEKTEIRAITDDQKNPDYKMLLQNRVKEHEYEAFKQN